MKFVFKAACSVATLLCVILQVVFNLQLPGS